MKKYLIVLIFALFVTSLNANPLNEKKEIVSGNRRYVITVTGVGMMGDATIKLIAYFKDRLLSTTRTQGVEGHLGRVRVDKINNKDKVIVTMFSYGKGGYISDYIYVFGDNGWEMDKAKPVIPPFNARDKKNVRVMIPKRILKDKQRQTSTAGNVEVIIEAVSVYYGDHQGIWPKKLEDLAPAYIKEIPPEYFTNSNKILNVNDVEINNKNVHKFITGEGGWIYFPKSGKVFVNILERDGNGKFIYMYEHE